MTYSSGSPTLHSSQAKLGDKRWRYLNSWWIFPPILSFSILCWLGFLVAAIRTGQKKYWIFTAIYAAIFGVFLAFAAISDGDNSSLASNLAIPPFLVAWIGPTIHAAILNRDYLRTLAAKGEWFADSVSAHSMSPVNSNPAPFLGVSRNDYYAPNDRGPVTPPAPPSQPPATRPAQRESHAAGRTHSPAARTESFAARASSAALVHANSATVEALTEIEGVGPALARRLVTVRDARGGYRDLDDLASAANLQPHELVRLRKNLTFEENNQTDPLPNNNPTQHGQTGRILDI